MESELLVVVVVIIAAYISLENAKIKQHDSILTGHLRYIEVVTHGNSALFFNHCGMQKHVFQLLLRKLTSAMGGLTDGTKIGAGEKIMMFLSVMRGNTYRDTSTVWQHGYKQVSKSVHEVLRSLLLCQQDLWDKPGENPVLSEYIRDNHHFFPYFHKCLRALDGTHIIAKVSPEMQQRFRGRKGVTQNVLGVCNFDMHFIIALAGWEGSAHDADQRTLFRELFCFWMCLKVFCFASICSSRQPCLTVVAPTTKFLDMGENSMILTELRQTRGYLRQS